MDDHSHDNDPRFVEYYANESLTANAAQRACGIMSAVMKARRLNGDAVDDLLVADIGCNAGTQSRVWLERGHRIRALDVSRDLVELARKRNADFASRAQFDVGSATALPWDSSQFDVCLLPELLEHVSDWETCISEATRVLKAGGYLFLSTTNVLCPIQHEFALPLYSWYPRRIKNYCVRRALSDAPQLANFATYPALHWFSPYGLKSSFAKLGVDVFDRFDLIDTTERGWAVKLIVTVLQAIPLARFCGYVLSPSTIVLGRKRG